jgi:exopolyphosphatase/guanosine-5'-triphosphate,3'-diphosphate pyrophosphatase
METMTKRIATIDIGTNTALLLIADLDAETRHLLPVLNVQEIIRMGKGVDEKRIIGQAAIERLCDTLTRYKKICAEHRVEQIIVVGTSALRDAGNRASIVTLLHEKFDLTLEILSGEEEAVWTFEGGISGLSMADARDALVLDIGGGSTEIVKGSLPMRTVESCAGNIHIPDDIRAELSPVIVEKTSLNIGSVRITERFLKTSPPKSDDVKAAFVFAKSEIEKVLPQFKPLPTNVIAVAGTATTISQVVQGLPKFVSEKIHGHSLRLSEVESLFEKFKALTAAEIELLGVDNGRADVITAGAVVLMSFMSVFQVPVLTVSDRGLRYGIAMRELMRL